MRCAPVSPKHSPACLQASGPMRYAAAMSDPARPLYLARLWRTQSKSQEARQMLAERYGWFSEGFDSVDLREAKALLEQLQRAGA